MKQIVILLVIALILGGCGLGYKQRHADCNMLLQESEMLLRDASTMIYKLEMERNLMRIERDSLQTIIDSMKANLPGIEFVPPVIKWSQP